MILVLIVGAVVALVLFPTFRCAVFHLFLLVWSGARDLFFYFKHKKYNLCPSGELVAYTGLFGRGKTLSAVHKVVSSYRRYNGKKVWCSRRGKMVTQRIKVISNVSLSSPTKIWSVWSKLCLQRSATRSMIMNMGPSL